MTAQSWRRRWARSTSCRRHRRASSRRQRRTEKSSGSQSQVVYWPPRKPCTLWATSSARSSWADCAPSQPRTQLTCTVSETPRTFANIGATSCGCSRVTCRRRAAARHAIDNISAHAESHMPTASVRPVNEVWFCIAQPRISARLVSSCGALVPSDSPSSADASLTHCRR